jgi:hypothetical protein
VIRSNVGCGQGSNALDALVPRAETQFANFRGGNGMLHVRWKKSLKESEIGGTGS